MFNAEDAEVGAKERGGGLSLRPLQYYLEGSSRAAKIFRTTLNPEPRTLNLERERRGPWRSKFEVQGSTVQSLFWFRTTSHWARPRPATGLRKLFFLG